MCLGWPFFASEIASLQTKIAQLEMMNSMADEGKQAWIDEVDKLVKENQKLKNENKRLKEELQLLKNK